MNDASGDAVTSHARRADPGTKRLPSPPREDQHDHEDEHHSHLDPSRWWFASSAFPMIAGTLGPVASAFSICALVCPWRQFYPPGTVLDDAPFVADPVWLTVINGVQLAIALISNMALLLNMTRRLRFSIAQPVTIVGWYLSSVTLVALTATADGPLVIQPEEEYVWSQSFYYAMYSAILYFVVASLMLVTFLGAQAGKYPKDFMLTPSQRTLMLQTISFLMYLLLGALVFSNVEGWSYLDAVYWAAVTLFTVGFGDFFATTTLGRALLIPYALIGIISLGLVIGSIRSLVLERGKMRFNARIMEKKRRQMLRNMTKSGKDGILEPIHDGEVLGGSSVGLRGLTEFERREEEFKLMRKIQEIAGRRRRWYSMAISGSTWLVLWLVGAKILQECELPYQGWDYLTASYFAFVSLTTIGYGDVTPVSNGGKSFWVFWALLALPTMTVLISNAGDTIIKWVRDATDRIGSITILPGDRGFKKDFKLLLKKLSFGKLFEEEIEEAPPGFLGEAQRHQYSDEDEEDSEDEIEAAVEETENELLAEGVAPDDVQQKKAGEGDDAGVHPRRVAANMEDFSKPSPSRQITFSDQGSIASGHKSRSRRPSTAGSGGHQNPSSSSQLIKFTRATSMPRQVLPEIPSNKAEYHVTLAEEIVRVIQHLKSNPPRKYTFPEWAWYLRLIGEDESDALKHIKAHPHTRDHDHDEKHHKLHRKWTNEKGKEKGKDDGMIEMQHADSWSWVGSRSPLMGSKEEAEWVLERLMAKLTEELRGAAKTQRRRSRGFGSFVGAGG